MTVCSDLINSYLYVLLKYDDNNDGAISTAEADQARADYSAGLITLAERDAVISFKNNNCSYTCADVKNQYEYLWQKYDADRSGTINSDEQNNAYVDYQNGKITEYEFWAVYWAYLYGTVWDTTCTFTPRSLNVTKIGITILGEPQGYPTQRIITEYKNFIEANSSLRLDLTVKRFPDTVVPSELIYFGEPWNGWFFEPDNATTTTRTRLPIDVHINTILYKTPAGYTPPFGGLSYGGNDDITGNNIPSNALVIGEWSSQIQPDGPWPFGLTNAMVHEFLHGLGGIGSQAGTSRESSILGILGFPENFIEIDRCCFYGFNGYDWTPEGCPDPNDPGWQNCMRFFLNQVTSPMYTALQTLGTVTFRTNPGGCDIWKNNIYTPQVRLGTTDSSGNLSIMNLASGSIDFIAKKTGYLDSAEARVIAIGSQSVNSPIVSLCKQPVMNVTLS